MEKEVLWQTISLCCFCCFVGIAGGVFFSNYLLPPNNMSVAENIFNDIVQSLSL